MRLASSGRPLILLAHHPERLSIASLFVVGIAGCGPLASARESETQGPSLSPIHHHLEVDPSLERMTETLCSQGPWTDRLVSIHAEARARLVRAEIVHSDGAAEPVDAGPEGRPIGIATRGLEPADCVRLVIDLASPGGGMNGCFRTTGVVTCATSAWLLAAEPWRPSAHHRVTLALPAGASMSPIFAREADGSLYLDERSHRYVGYAAIGALETRGVPVPGGCASLTVPAASPLARSPHLVPWIARAGLATAHLGGVSPARDVAITAVAMPGSSPVLFGMAGRGVVASAILLAGESAGPELETDWTLVHELAHLTMPYVRPEDAWLSEGLATYYQEVLRARGGLQSPEAAWRELDDGFRRGALDGTGRTLREESRNMHASHAYTRVYWAGAAIALLWDAALRARGAGTLDERIARLADLRDRTMTADELIATLDIEDGLLRAIADRWLDETRFPETPPSSARPEGLMNPRAAVASNGPCAGTIGRPVATDIE